MSTVTRPALRYHGGKFRLAPWLLQFFPPHGCYVESFGGAASVLLRKPTVYAELLTLAMIYGRCEPVGEHCQIWTQATSTKGNRPGTPYAQHGGKVVNLRRLVYELAHGEIPEGRNIRPRCGHPQCLSEHCLEALTRRSWSRALARAGVYSTPDAHAARLAGMRRRDAHRMTMERARAIRAAEGTTADVARRFGISWKVAHNIRQGLSWKEEACIPQASVFALAQHQGTAG